MVLEILDAHPELIAYRNKIGWTLLHQASCNNSYAVAETLLSRGADANAAGRSGETPLHLADSVRMANILMVGGADPNRLDDNKMSPLDFANGEKNAALAALLEGELLKKIGRG